LGDFPVSGCRGDLDFSDRARSGYRFRGASRKTWEPGKGLSKGWKEARSWGADQTLGPMPTRGAAHSARRLRSLASLCSSLVRADPDPGAEYPPHSRRAGGRSGRRRLSTSGEHCPALRSGHSEHGGRWPYREPLPGLGTPGRGADASHPWGAQPPPDRVSLSARALSDAREVMILVTGVEKGGPIAAWRAGETLPVADIGGAGGVDVLIDRDANGA